jgi:hypothetical protein
MRSEVDEILNLQNKLLKNASCNCPFKLQTDIKKYSHVVFRCKILLFVLDTPGDLEVFYEIMFQIPIFQRTASL